jgi:hypothetical protein
MLVAQHGGIRRNKPAICATRAGRQTVGYQTEQRQ